MARYLTDEELFECTHCKVQAARREFYSHCHELRCPSCSLPSFQRVTGCEVKNNDDLFCPKPMAGILSFRYMGFGHIDLPQISIQEERWEPDYCHVCYQHEMVRKLKVFDGAEVVGIKRPYRMPGIDVTSGGGHLIIPFFSSNRLWIDGKEVAHMEFYDKKSNNWDYYL